MALVWVFISLSVCCFLVGIQGNPMSRHWTYLEDDGTEVDVIPATMLHKRDQSLEIQRDKRCRCYCRRKWEREYVCCECADSTCFPGSARVTMDNGNVKTIDELKPGNRVLSADLDGSLHFTTVLGYLDRRRDVISQYYKILTSSGAQLALSGSHVIYVSTGETTDHEPRYASAVQIGDHVMTRQDDRSVRTMVTNVTLEGMKGAYVPLTESGTILVDDILTSCYASFPHDVAHVAMAPLRWFPSLVTLTPDDGVHPYVSFMKTIGRSLLPNKWLFSIPMNEYVSSAEHLYYVGKELNLATDMEHSEL